MSDVKTYVAGHKSPDTDSICSAISFANLLTQMGTPATPVCAGEANKETTYILNHFGFEHPQIVKNWEEFAPEGGNLYLTDHNESKQIIDGYKSMNMCGVVDHHRIGDFETDGPVFMRLEPVGSASSIVYRMFKENNVEVPKEVAGLLLSGLISDTLLLKSPTTHASDPAVAAELAVIAGVNLEEYGLAMLKAGTNLSSKSAEELIDIDAKTFELNGNQVRVAQVNTVDISDVLSRQAEIEEAINNSIKNNGYSDFVLMITDILNSNSEILALGLNTDKVEAAFNFVLENNHAFLEGAVSRKKQVVPQLTESFNA